MNVNPANDIIKELIAQKLISQEQLDKIKQNVKDEDIEAVLVKEKIIDSEKLAEIKGKIWKVPYVSLLEIDIKRDVLLIISDSVAKNYQLICFNKKGNNIDIGIVDPGNLRAQEAINFFAKGQKFKVKYHVISSASFKKAFDQYKSLSEEVEVALQAREDEEESDKGKKGKKRNKEGIEEISKAAPVSKIVSVIIRHAVDGRASDIHIEPVKNESRVRYRIDGVLHTSLVLPRSVHDAVVARIKVMANAKLDETRLPQDGRIRLDFEGKQIDFRVSILPLVDTEKVVMRILDVSRGAPKLADLGFEGRNFEIISKNIKKTDGLFLVTGPTGSGKSTTLFSVLSMTNKEGVNISTLEDPVEYFLDGVNQSQVRADIGFTFASGLRSLLRQDPDIIMVGEIRDNETAELAIHAALTGHMVFSTLHTNSASATIPRLLDMEVEPFLLASTLNTVLAQRLVRKICSKCKATVEVADDVKKNITAEVEKMYDIVDDEIKKLFDTTVLDKGKKDIIYKGKGCSRCGNSGYSGRLAIAEVIDVDDAVKESIINKTELKNDSEALKNQHFITVKQDGIIRALQGLTSMEEVLRVMAD